MSAPTYTELIDGAADVLEGLTTAGKVVRDPKYCTEEAEYARMLMDDNGLVDGWLVAVVGEDEEETKGTDGATQFVRLGITGMLTVNPTRTPVSSREYFGTKTAEARDAFRGSTNRDLGLNDPGPNGTGVNVRQYGLYAPDGYFPIQLDTQLVHLARMEMRVWVSFC